MAELVGALDQGTTSTRFMLFDAGGRIVGSAQREHRQIYPRSGWVEHDPMEIVERSREVIDLACAEAHITARDVAVIGITNQRETTVVWERASGRPVMNALVWQDIRTASTVEELTRVHGQEAVRERTGLPLATYFSSLKLRWILDHVEGARERAARGELLAGTVDSFLLWHLTGGPEGGLHATDVTNASRTQLMDLGTLAWDDELLALFQVPRAVLPEIRSSSGDFGELKSTVLRGVRIGGVLGDQHAALVGQTCFQPGQAKNTYGTGCFLLMNTGRERVRSRHGLLTTLAYRFGTEPAVYALEGSIAITGALVQWVRDNLRMIGTSGEIESLARTVDDNGGVYLVPAFSGLYAPHWDATARGLIIGLTRYANRGHIARAVLEATAFQTREVVDAMEADSGVALHQLRTDGGMVVNDLLMQTQADLLGRSVVRPRVAETTALGAAYAAGLATGFYRSLPDLCSQWAVDRTWQPATEPREREGRYRQWQRAVERCRGWAVSDSETSSKES